MSAEKLQELAEVILAAAAGTKAMESIQSGLSALWRSLETPVILNKFCQYRLVAGFVYLIQAADGSYSVRELWHRAEDDDEYRIDLT